MLRGIDLTLGVFFSQLFVQKRPRTTAIMVATNKMKTKSTEGPVERRYEQVCIDKGELSVRVTALGVCVHEQPAGGGCSYNRCGSNVHLKETTWPQSCAKVLWVSSGFLKVFCSFPLVSSTWWFLESCKPINFDLSDIKMIKDELANFKLIFLILAACQICNLFYI